MAQQDRVRPPSILDVARHAGVSYQTVSRVLNEHPQIRPETAERVQRAIGELGYRPNRAARALVTQRTRTIGMLLTGRALHGAFSSYLAVVDAARAHGYAVTATPTASDGPDEIARALGELLGHGVDGIIAIAPQDDARREIRNLTTRIPLVTMQGGSAELEGFGFDQRQAIREAVTHLTALGHTRILHLPGPRGWAEADERALGYELGMRAAGLEPIAAPPADWTPEGGQRAALAALPGSGITAVIAANDEMAIGAIAAARTLGLRIPDDLSVVGIDDVPFAAFVDPPLTTLRIDFALLGRRALDALVAEIEGTVGGTAVPRIPPELIVRGSTAKVTDR